MNARERTLLIALLVVLLVVGGGFAGQQYVYKPYMSARSRLNDALADLEAKKQDLEKERKKKSDLLDVDPRLAQWKRLSIPESTKRDPKDIDKHQERMQEEYRRYLSGVLTRAGFRDPRPNAAAGSGPTITPDPPDSKTSPELPGKTPMYTRFAFKVDANADYDGLRKALEELDRTPLLHEVRKLALTKSATRRDNSLDIKMTVEVLLVNGDQQRETLLPPSRWFLQTPVVLDKPDRDYGAMLAKNIWTGTAADRNGTVTENQKTVLEHVKLTMIHRELELVYERRPVPPKRWWKKATKEWITEKGPSKTHWEARLYDQGKGGDEMRLSVSEDGKKEGHDEFTVADTYKNVVFVGKVLAVTERCVFFTEKGQMRLYCVEVGDVLYNARPVFDLREPTAVLKGPPVVEEER